MCKSLVSSRTVHAVVGLLRKIAHSAIYYYSALCAIVEIKVRLVRFIFIFNLFIYI